MGSPFFDGKSLLEMVRRGFVKLASLSRWLLACCLLWLGCALIFAMTPTAADASPAVFPVASLHTYQEQPGQTTFRSKQSLRDRSDRSWQVILFKRYQGKDLQGMYLRLVGFPGLVTLNTAAPLNIETGASLQWKAEPALDPQTPDLPKYAGQYDVSSTLEALEGDIPLQIDISLTGGSVAQLVVPPFAVAEWRELAAQSPA